MKYGTFCGKMDGFLTRTAVCSCAVFACIKDMNNIYLTTDGNVIYGFNENLELLSGFPLAGCGAPIFTDVNGDRILDCLVQTIDKKINAWNLR